MKVNIVRQPRGVLEGLALHKYHIGTTYDLPAPLAAYLVAEGFAIVEMRLDSNQQTVIPDRRYKGAPR